MNRLKGYIDTYFIESVAKFCIDNKIENINFTLSNEIIWSYIFLDWGNEIHNYDFDDFMDAYSNYKYAIAEGTF